MYVCACIIFVVVGYAAVTGTHFSSPFFGRTFAWKMTMHKLRRQNCQIHRVMHGVMLHLLPPDMTRECGWSKELRRIHWFVLATCFGMHAHVETACLYLHQFTF